MPKSDQAKVIRKPEPLHPLNVVCAYDILFLVICNISYCNYILYIISSYDILCIFSIFMTIALNGGISLYSTQLRAMPSVEERFLIAATSWCRTTLRKFWEDYNRGKWGKEDKTKTYTYEYEHIRTVLKDIERCQMCTSPGKDREVSEFSCSTPVTVAGNTSQPVNVS